MAGVSMDRSTHKVLLLIVGVLIGGIIAWMAKPDSNNQSNSMSGQNTSSSTNSSQQSAMAKTQAGDKKTKKMISDLQSKTGIDFDTAFINGIVEHHLAATSMAKYVDNEAPHDEIKKLANSIISSQSQQIGELQDIAIAQGYNLQPPDPAMLDSMTAMLNGKTGNDLEKQFMADMIKHHQAALDMAKPAATNANNADVKRIAAEMIDEQTKEIAQLRAWGQQWGYNL